MASQKVVERKKQEVEELTAQLKDAQSAVVFEYHGIDVAGISKLRKDLHDQNISVTVAKNNIFRRASKECGYDGLEEYLTGPNALAISPEDPVLAAKIIYDFSKTNENLKIKTGIVEGKILNGEEITTVAKLPSREGLLSMLLSVLQAPVRNFAYAVKAVAENKEENTEA